MTVKTNKAMIALQQAAINSIQNMDSTVQEYLVAEVQHIERHRNPTRLNEFFAAVTGKGSRTIAMHGFIQHYGNVIYNEDDKTYKVQKARNVNMKELVADMEENPWYTFKPEPKARQFDIVARIESLLKQAHTAADNGMLINGDDKTLEVIEETLRKAKVLPEVEDQSVADLVPANGNK